MSAEASETAHKRKSPSLEEVHRTVRVNHVSFFRRLFAFAGPAYLVSVGYMDPGNWATDIEGGSRFGFALLWVLLASNLIALLVQTLAARMGIVAGRDLAQASRDMYRRPLRIMLWLLCEAAIAACDLAEVIGTVIGLNLLFGLSLKIGLVITVFDTLLLLAIQRLGIRKMEAFILTLVLTIGICFVIEVFWSQPQWGMVARGLVPHLSATPPFLFPNVGALYVAMGILGATVMPHNLYLHSALVQSRSVERTPEGMKEACKFNFIDSFFALNAAFIVNASILVLAGAAFFSRGEVVTSIEQAYKLLPSFLGPTLAATLFAIALLCSGQSSTLTGTLAGQIVMEGFVSLRVRPWIRRLLTRSIAVIPAAVVIFFIGGDRLMDLLIFSQVILSLQLPFAIIPLLQFTGDRRQMGAFASPLWVKLLGWSVAVIIISLNGYLVYGQVGVWSALLANAGWSPLWLRLTVFPVIILFAGLLGWIILLPFVDKRRDQISHGRADARHVIDALRVPHLKRIAVAVENLAEDAQAISHAIALAKTHNAELIVIHVVEGVGAQWYGEETGDEERVDDQAYIEDISRQLGEIGVRARGILRYGSPAEELIKTIKRENIDFIVMRAHGHGTIADHVFGHTIEKIRHATAIPVLAVRGGTAGDA